MTSYVAHLRGPKVRLQVDIDAPTKALAEQAAHSYARHEKGKLEVVTIHERPHVLRVDPNSNLWIARYADDWVPYPDEIAHLNSTPKD